MTDDTNTPRRGFAKLDSGIVDSSIWVRPDDVLRAWIALLAKADNLGFVRAAAPAMAHLCPGMTLERWEQIVDELCAPDEHSRTPDDDGRRLQRIKGGYLILNYLRYRDMAQRKGESGAERQKRYRDRVNERTQRLGHTVTPTVTGDVDAEAERDNRNREKTEQDQKKPDAQKRAGSSAGKVKSEACTYEAFITACKEAGQKPIPEDAAVFRYAEDVGIPREFLLLAWREFTRRYGEGKKKQKGVRGWRQAFDNSVRGNWFKLWFLEGDSVGLTTAGKQAEREMRSRTK